VGKQSFTVTKNDIIQQIITTSCQSDWVILWSSVLS